MVAPIVVMSNEEKHSGVSGIPTQLLVLHSGECPLRGGYAQSLTQWANIPLKDGGPEASWHWFVDPIAIVSQVAAIYAAWHASEANPMSEGFEQAGYARFSRAEWMTPEGLKQLDNLAWIMAQRAIANNIPPVWLTTAEVEAVTKRGNRSIKGLCLHRQIDPETRTDPGDGYPYELLLAQIKHHMGQGETVPAPVEKKEDEDMLTIFRDTAAADPDKTWIGNALFKRHIATPQMLADYQLMAREGKMSIAKNGDVQILPEGLFGKDIGLLDAHSIIDQRTAELVREVRDNTAHSANRVLDVLAAAPDVNIPAEILEQIREQIASGAQDTVEQIKAGLSDIEVTLTAK